MCEVMMRMGMKHERTFQYPAPSSIFAIQRESGIAMLVDSCLCAMGYYQADGLLQFPPNPISDNRVSMHTLWSDIFQ